MKKNIFIAIHFNSIFAFAQTNDQIIKGNIKDEKKQAIEFANVYLLNTKDSSLVKGAITNENGDFEITNFSPGEYIIKCSQISFAIY